MDVTKINELIKSQETDSGEIKKLWTNIKKDSSTRKTQKYIKERRAQLDSIYDRARQNHMLLANQEVLSSHEYMTLDFFANQIKKYYVDAKDHLQKCEERLHIVDQIYVPKTNDQDTDQDMVSSPKLFIQMYKINQLKKRLTNAETAIMENKSVWQLQTLLQSLQKQWQDIETTHIELLMEQSTLEHEYFTDNYYDKLQDEFEKVIGQLNEKINANDNQTNYFNRLPKTKLPTITIPVFTGTYESWNSFYDLFMRIIHDDCTISKTEKMQYLKTHVKGEAEKLIRHLNVNEVNYEAALTLLINRYKDERIIVNKCIDKLLDMPKINNSNATMLRNMHDTVNACLEALKNQNINVTTWGPILTRIICRKWDHTTNIKYEEQLEEANKVDDFEKLMKFLEKRFKSLETTLSYQSTVHNVNSNNKSAFTSISEKKSLCWYCQNEHNIHQCPNFMKLDVNERIKKVKEKKMCYLCLQHGDSKKCISQKFKSCEICKKAHNSLLHRSLDEYLKYNTKQNTSRKPPPSKQETVSSNMTSTINDKNKTVLLATALVQTTSFDGTPHLLRVLCDQGSEASFCTEEVAQLLGFPKQRINAEIIGIGDEKPKTSNYIIDIILRPRFTSEFTLPTSLIVLTKLTNSLPNQDVQQLKTETISNKVIADPTYYKRGPIDIILGAEDYSKLLLKGYERLEHGIITQNTEFGWILSGFCPTETNHRIKILSLMTRIEDMKQLTRFWELEEDQESQTLSKEDTQCETYFNQTTIRNNDGTYTVRLPFKDSTIKYGNTRQKALARQIQLEKKLDRNPDLRQQYNQFMTEYLNMNHMKKVNKRHYNEGKFYIPHQPVIREDALTTKLRVVFDASSKDNTNLSLNDNMLKGPRLQQDLATILLRWRKHKIAFMADIEKMYRFIKINEDDYTYQRILWRFFPEKPIEEYELTTVTYGTTAAPYLAVKTLQQLAKNESKNYPIASKVTLEDFYVDDILSGEKDITSAKTLQDQLKDMLHSGGFNLRKWSSNSTELLENIPDENKEDKMLKLPIDENRKSSSPHFRGIWEAGVKCIKHHLRRVIADTTMTYEELTTFLHQIEACLNSRPLCVQTENINDNTVLTPSHFLIGREAVSVPDPISNINTDILNRWKQIQRMKKQFWDSWTRDYLQQLQQRYKWKNNENNLKEGTVVIVKDDNISPSKWPIAIIKEIHPGSDGATRVVTLKRSCGADQKRSIHTLIPLPVNSSSKDTTEITCVTPVKSNLATVQKPNRPRNNKKLGGLNWLYMWMLVLQLMYQPTTAHTNYNLKSMRPGIYVEQLGTASVNRGTFRIETNFERKQIEHYLNKMKETSEQFKKLCDNAISVDSLTHCSQFHHHLKEEVGKFEKTKDYLTEINNTRKKRGILGQIMTSIFGVNDEVYRDLNTLQQNQQKLIEAANHQTKFMISTISTVNQTEERIRNKLERFTIKLNQATKYINTYNVWYTQIDNNHVKIQVMQTYHLAYNYMEEIINYYSGLLEIYLAKATIYSILSPKHVQDIIASAKSKLPSNLRIIQAQLMDTKLTENETHIQVNAYYPIEESAKYTLLHLTPIPKKVDNQSVQSLIIQKKVVAVNYNSEHYFELSHEEWKECLQKFSHYICFPVAVKNMQLNENCIVWQLFKNSSTTECLTTTYKLTTDIIWKQLQMLNTWLFITRNPATASVICDGQREEVLFQDVGIIKISENCVIKTDSNILVARRTTSMTILGSYYKNYNFSLNSTVKFNRLIDISKEQVLDSSKDLFQQLINKEKSLQTELDNTVWQSINFRIYVASFGSLFAFTVTTVLIYCYGPQIRRCIRARATTETAVEEMSEQPASLPPNRSARKTSCMPVYAAPRRIKTKQKQPEDIELYQMKPFSERREDVHL